MQKGKQRTSVKRHSELNNPKQLEKKSRLHESKTRNVEGNIVSHEYNTENEENSYLESDLSIFESTLGSINVTNILETNEISPDRARIDPFRNLSFSDNINQQQESETDLELSQFFNTQVIKQLDNVTTNIENPIKSDFLKNEMESPLMHSFEERLKMKSISKISIDEEIKERSGLFEDEKITIQYRQEVDNLFDELEQTIFTMGVGKSQKIPDDILNVIFNTGYEHPPTKDIKLEEIEKTNLREPNEPSPNKSFYDIIKQALKKSGEQSGSSKENINKSNISINLTKMEYIALGPFYGLPIKVKELIMQYKGIEELYGEF